jgi:hypothetical protein
LNATNGIFATPKLIQADCSRHFRVTLFLC